MSRPRSLADDLRQRDDEALGLLLSRRPDLLHPVPADFTALTTRATSPPAVARCLDALDAMRLHVLRAAADLTVDGTASAEDIARAAADQVQERAPGAEGGEVLDACRAALDDLVALALVWGLPDGLRAVLPARDLVTAARLPRWPPVDIRGGPSVGGPVDPGEREAIDAQAAVHARECLALVRDLLDDWSVDPPPVLRSGGLSVRDFASARSSLHTDWARASVVIEVCHAARLVADDGGDPAHWVPTDQFDTWVDMSPAEQWLLIVEAWLSLPRLACLADARTHVLSTERDRRAIPLMRSEVLALLAEADSDAVDEERIVAILDERQPRRAGELRRLTVQATLREATDLGLTGGGVLSTAGRLLLDVQRAASPASRQAAIRSVAEALTRALPVDIDHVLIQADLTIVAPGPLVASAARGLRLLADVESRGHATVFRVTEHSLRRAFDAGWDADTIHRLLSDLSRTPVPQPLTYLIDDTARRHGAVRVGAAMSYIRSDSPEALGAMVVDRRLRGLGLHRVADTVILSQAPASEVIPALRQAGYAPAAEAPDGTVVIRRPDEQRIRTPRRPATTTRRPPEDALVTAAVRTLRAGDAAARPRRAAMVGPAATTDAPSLSTSALTATLRDAVAESRPLWIGYADSDGTVTQQIIDPIRMQAGILTAYDHRTDGVRTFAVSRITGLADAAEPGD